MNKDFMVTGEEMFEIVRKVRESHSPVIEKWKEITGADKVFRKDGFLFFCKTVTEPEYTITPWEEESRAEESVESLPDEDK
jgi:hypothetical protein